MYLEVETFASMAEELLQTVLSDGVDRIELDGIVKKMLPAIYDNVVDKGIYIFLSQNEID